MKAKFIRGDMEVSPKETFRPKLMVERSVLRNKRQQVVRYWKLGAEWEHPQAHILVEQGCAIPADDECAKACGMTSEDMQRAQEAYERANRGIHPDDFEKYAAGEIAGYDGDGNYIPGPNAKTFSDDDGEESEDLSGEY